MTLSNNYEHDDDDDDDEGGGQMKVTLTRELKASNSIMFVYCYSYQDPYLQCS